MALKLRSRDLRTGRAPKDLKILLSKLFHAKFKRVSFLSLDKQSDSGKKKKKKCHIILCISTIIVKQQKKMH